MAITTQEIQVQWSAADSASVAAGNALDSDEITFTSGTVFQARVQCKADNSGTPTSGDVVKFYLLEGLGDPDGSGSLEFASSEHGIHLITLDTNVEDPAQSVVWLPGPFNKAKIRAVNDGASAATVSCLIFEQNG